MMQAPDTTDIVKKEKQQGADYYSITTGSGELGIGQHAQLVHYVHDTLSKMTVSDPKIIANSGIMAETKTVAIPAAVFNGLTDDQKKALLEPIAGMLAIYRSNRAFFQEALDEHNKTGQALLSLSTDKDHKTTYQLYYHTTEGAAGVVEKKQAGLLVEKLNRMTGKKVAFLDELKGNKYWAGNVCIPQDNVPDLVTSPNREAIFEALAHPEALKKESFLNQILGSGKGAENRPGALSFLKE